MAWMQLTSAHGTKRTTHAGGTMSVDRAKAEVEFQKREAAFRKALIEEPGVRRQQTRQMQ